MRAIIRTEPGPPSVLKLDANYPTPKPRKDHVLIKIKAIGLNRAELRSRAGDPPAKTEFISDDLFTTDPPKVLGEECVGIVVDNGGSSRCEKGDVVATYFCGIGKVSDGAYAEYTLVPARFAYKLESDLPWEVLGAIPATMMTAWGSLHRALEVLVSETGAQTLFVHGGTSSVGSAAIMLAKFAGCRVAATTRQEGKVEGLKKLGADVVLIDEGDGKLGEKLKKHKGFEKGAKNVLELVGPDKIAEAFTCTERMGTVCVTGVLTKTWALGDFAPAEGIETGKKLTTYQCPRQALEEDHGVLLQAILRNVDLGNMDLAVLLGKTLHGLESIKEAHELMEASKVSGKVVVLLD